MTNHIYEAFFVVFLRTMNADKTGNWQRLVTLLVTTISYITNTLLLHY